METQEALPTVRCWMARVTRPDDTGTWVSNAAPGRALPQSQHLQIFMTLCTS